MDLQEVIRRRKMVRSFEDRPIPPEILDRILRNWRRAPSAGFSQGLALLVLEGKAETSRYWDALMPAERRGRWGWPDLFNAPVLIACLSSKEVYLSRYAEPDKGWTDRSESHWPVPYWHVDAGMAAMIVLLDAVDAGLGALFFGVFDQARFRETFGVPDEWAAVGMIALGYPKPVDRPSPSLARGRKPVAEVIHRGRW
ncbi:MAG TPA: nitroreductase family protein [Candidatus Limnocylindria bacterium]|nr:nitroreductase family protein [Candidatus Limnocylindria bacterium]